MKPTWPEKKEGLYGHDLDSCSCGYCWFTRGMNQGIALCTAYKESHKPHACKCQRHPDAAFTDVSVGEGLMGCSECGGIIIPRAKQ